MAVLADDSEKTGRPASMCCAPTCACGTSVIPGPMLPRS